MNDSGPACRRCRADLALVWRVEHERQRVLARAWRSAALGHWPDAQQLIDRAAQLRGGPDIARCRAVLSLLQGDFDGAWRHAQTVDDAADH
jgi:hypothetical protein